MDSINVELIKYSHNVQISIEDHLSGVYRREFESALQGLNVAIKPVINTEAIKAIINYPYAGAMFSDRVWRNKSQLLNWIEDDLTKNLIKGMLETPIPTTATFLFFINSLNSLKSFFILNPPQNINFYII